MDDGCGSSRGRVSDPRLLILVGAPFALRGISSAPEEPEGGSSKNGVVERSSGLDMSFPERMELGVPALEDMSFSLVGEIDLARSVQLR